jgi:hypothetical protein
LAPACSISSKGTEGLFAPATSDDSGSDVPVACTSDKQCTTRGQLCVQGTCTLVEKCQDSLDCSTGKVCDPMTNRCVECTIDADCAADQLCDQGICRAKCASDADCSALGLLCDTAAGHCVACPATASCQTASPIDAGIDRAVLQPERDAARDVAPEAVAPILAPAEGLQGYWRFDDAAGTHAEDSSGFGHRGTLQGPATWATGKFGSALNLNGKSAFVEIPGPVVDTSKPFTVAAFVRLPTQTPGYMTIVSIDGTTGSGFYLQERLDLGSFAFVMTETDTTADPILAGAKNPPAAGVWYHLAGVYDGATLALYVDGILQESTPYSSGWRAAGSTCIGRGKYDGSPTDYLAGLVDEVRLYSRALSTQEVAKLANP